MSVVSGFTLLFVKIKQATGANLPQLGKEDFETFLRQRCEDCAHEKLGKDV